MIRKAAAFVLCVLLAAPAFAEGRQAQSERQKEAAKGQAMFLVGLGVMATGLTPLFMGTSKSVAIGLPIVAGGAYLAYYGRNKRKKAESMPSVSWGVVPLKKGVAVGVVKRW